MALVDDAAASADKAVASADMAAASADMAAASADVALVADTHTGQLVSVHTVDVVGKVDMVSAGMVAPQADVDPGGEVVGMVVLDHSMKQKITQGKKYPLSMMSRTRYS